MKKVFNRSMAIILSLITIFGCLAFSGFASDEILIEPDSQAADVLQKEEQPEEQTEEFQYEEDTVALIYLCSNASGFPSLGHIWVYIENVSKDKEILEVGVYKLLPGEGVSLGEFGLTRSDGFGLHYNVENYTYNLFAVSENEEDRGKVNNVKYMCGELDKETLAKISNKIRNLNWWDPIIFNCVTFACSIWNAGKNGFIFPWTVFPGITRLNIKRRVDGKERDEKYDLNMKYFCYEKKENPADYNNEDLDKAPAEFSSDKEQNVSDFRYNNVWKQSGRGKNASVHVVKAGTVDTPPG